MTESQTHRKRWPFVVTAPKYLYPVIGLLSVIGVVAAVVLKEPGHFARVGSFVIGVGVWMSMRYTIREGINRHKSMLRLSPTAPGTNRLNSEFLNEMALSIEDATLQLHGFAIVIYGSLVSSMGDIVMQFVLELC